MRIRHLYTLIIGAALASACSLVEVDKPDNTISFAPVASKATKAIISGTTYPTSESFVVSAYLNGTDAYFEDVTASYSSSLALWETTVSQYWPLTGSLSFIAYSPSSASGVSIDATNGVTATGYTIQNTEQMSTDFCYASASVADCASHPDAVSMTFSHALSQVVFRVKAAGYYSNSSRTVNLALRSLSMQGIMSVGDFAEGAWENQGTEYEYTLSNTPITLTYDAQDRPETIDVCSYLFLPQELGPYAAISVGYNVVQTISNTDYTLQNAPILIPLGGTINEWQPGKKYIYTLNIGMNNVITFTVSAVGWQDESNNIIVEEN